MSASSSNRCDFCNSSERPASWVHPTEPLPVEEVNEASRGQWLACDECHALIVAGNRYELCQRTVEALGHVTAIREGKMRVLSREEIINSIAPVHEMFFNARFGTAMRIM